MFCTSNLLKPWYRITRFMTCVLLIIQWKHPQIKTVLCGNVGNIGFILQKKSRSNIVSHPRLFKPQVWCSGTGWERKVWSPGDSQRRLETGNKYTADLWPITKTKAGQREGERGHGFEGEKRCMAVCASAGLSNLKTVRPNTLPLGGSACVHCGPACLHLFQILPPPSSRGSPAPRPPASQWPRSGCRHTHTVELDLWVGFSFQGAVGVVCANATGDLLQVVFQIYFWRQQLNTFITLDMWVLWNTQWLLKCKCLKMCEYDEKTN